MATAKKLASGSWRCQVYSHTEEIQQPDGSTKKKRIYKSFTCDVKGPKGKRICEKMAADWAESKENQTKIQDITFGEAVDNYIQSRIPVLSPLTVTGYKQIKKNNLTSLCNIKLQNLRQEDIQKTINKESLNHSPKTLRNINGLITAVLRYYRPDMTVNTVLPAKVRPDLYIPSDEEIKILLNAVKDTEMELPVFLAAFGPMRRGEICALRIENINGNVVHVCENMIRDTERNWIIKQPKSYAGDRYIEYPDFVAEKWKDVSSGRIVSLNPDMITNRFGKLLKKHGIPHFRFHDLRHYSASVLHALGVPDAYIMERGGWGNDSVLKSVYRHTMEEKQKQLSNIANTHFNTLYKTVCNTTYNTN